MDETQSSERNLRIYLRIFGRRFHWFLAVALLGVAIAITFTLGQKKQYSATAQILVVPTSGSIPTSGTEPTVSPTQVGTELQLVTSGPVKALVKRTLGFTPHVSAVGVSLTTLINVTATAGTAQRAAHIANTYAETFVAYQKNNAIVALNATEVQLLAQIAALDAQLAPLEKVTPPSADTTVTISALADQEALLKEQLAQLQVTATETPGGVEVVSHATPPTSPSGPKRLRDGAIGLGIGIVLGVGAAFTAERLDDKVYTKDEAERLSGGIPVMAAIPRIRSWRRSKRPMIIAALDTLSPVTESYRLLRTSLQFVVHDALPAHLKTILVTSASGAEGKTSTVANLGVVLAKTGQKVVIVSGDLRRPRIATFFDQEETPGLTSVLLGHEELENVLFPVSNVPGLTLLRAGPIPENPTELLGSNRAAEVFHSLAATFDMVLIDSPPVLPVTDPLVLSGYADAILMVVMAGTTTQAEVEQASEAMAQIKARPTGLVLNRATRRSGTRSKYRYNYKYNYRPHLPETTNNGDATTAREVEQAT